MACLESEGSFECGGLPGQDRYNASTMGWKTALCSCTVSLKLMLEKHGTAPTMRRFLWSCSVSVKQAICSLQLQCQCARDQPSLCVYEPFCREQCCSMGMLVRPEVYCSGCFPCIL